MPLSLLAVAEPELSWARISNEFARVLRPGEWQSLITRPGQIGHQAFVAVEPADPITVTLREGLLLVHADTTPWGPGYHQRVVQVLDTLELVLPGGWLRVDDPTGYYGDRERIRLEASYLRWAETLWGDEDLLRLAARRRHVAVCLGLGEGPAIVPEGQIATPVGFKSRAWIHQTLAGVQAALEGGCRPLPAEARAAFLWWNVRPDPFDWVQLGRAICTMDVIWRPVDGQDAPAQIQARERALWCFEAALRLDPCAPAPLEELRRLYQLLGRKPGEAARAAELARPVHDPFQGGYREGWVRRLLPGHWNVQLPGWLRAGCDDHDGHDVFWDDRMTVHVTTTIDRAAAFHVREQADRHLSLLPAQLRSRAQVHFLRHDSVEGYVVEVNTGTGGHMITGQVGRVGERVTFTVVARSAEGRAMALRLGNSLRPLV